MGWPLEINCHLALGAAFHRGLTGYAANEQSVPLEKSAALYQKPPGATSAVWFFHPNGCRCAHLARCRLAGVPLPL
jgi:hypothetical protein